MVTFYCDLCQASLKKAKAEFHRCGRNVTFSCVDCGVTFNTQGVKLHTQCMTEAEKVEGSMFKGKKFQASADGEGKVIDRNNKKGKADIPLAAPQMGGPESKSRDVNGDGAAKKRKTVEAASAPSASEARSKIAGLLFSLVDKKALLMSKLRKKAKKQLGEEMTAEQLGTALIELGGFVTLSKSVVSADDDD